MEDRERRLIAECLAGHKEAFGSLIAPYQDRVYNVLFRMTGNQEDAAELFQESMVRVYRGLGTYQADSSFYTWLYRIALNVAFSHRRRPKAPTINVDVAGRDAGWELVDQSEASHPSRGVEQEETRRVVEQSLAQIPDAYRVVLVLKDIDGLKYEEIAEILDVPVGTVRSRLHRARGELRDRLLPFLEKGVI